MTRKAIVTQAYVDMWEKAAEHVLHEYHNGFFRASEEYRRQHLLEEHEHCKKMAQRMRDRLGTEIEVL